MIDDITGLVRRYLACWNERDAERRLEIVTEVFAAEGRYVDPTVDISGATALAEHIGEAQKQLGDLVFSIDTLISAHHDTALVSWRLGPAGAADAVTTGYDSMLFADGQIQAVTATSPERSSPAYGAAKLDGGRNLDGCQSFSAVTVVSWQR